MTNRHRGEVSLTLGAERFALRLSLQALPKSKRLWARAICRGSASASPAGGSRRGISLRCSALRSAAGVRSSRMTSRQPDWCGGSASCRGGLVRPLRDLLRWGRQVAPSRAVAGSARSPARAFLWSEAMALGFGLLRLSPDAFWAMTLPELAGRSSRPAWRNRPSDAPDGETFHALMRLFPDERTNAHDG